MSIKFLRSLFQTRSQTLQIVQDTSNDGVSSINKSIQIRNITGFWILGVTNFYCYQLLLSAAHDLLSKEFFHLTTNATINYSVLNTSISFNNLSNNGKCNSLSSAAVLLAENVPMLCIKFILPFCFISPNVAVILIAFLLAGNLLLLAFSSAIWITFLSIIGMATGTGIGEVTLVKYSSFVYGKKEMIAWAAGTGGGAIFSSVIYATLTTAGLPVRTTLLMMVAVPFLMLIAYWCILKQPKDPLNEELQLTNNKTRTSMQSYNSIQPVSQSNLPIKIKKNLSFKREMNKIKMLLPYSLPLMVVYFAEYFINLGLYELIYFPEFWLTQSEQYRWFLGIYQTAVFLSRTFGTLFTFHKIWILPSLQVLNIIIFLSEVYFKFIPSIWIMLILILYEGLLGGASYVNIIAKMIDKITPNELEFALSIVVIADTFGVTVAGFLALPVHDYICSRLQ